MQEEDFWRVGCFLKQEFVLRDVPVANGLAHGALEDDLALLGPHLYQVVLARIE